MTHSSKCSGCLDVFGYGEGVGGLGEHGTIVVNILDCHSNCRFLTRD